MLSTLASLTLSTLLTSSVAVAASTELPTLGDSASSVVSLQQEHELGRTWLRQLRRGARTIDDPLAVEYLEQLAYRLIPYSNAQQSDFEFVVIDKAELNAFAVPGGIIGINLGIMLYAEDEDELAAVMSHELAHLSQRHFARQLERAEQQEPIAIATLLASILLIAMSDNPDAGIAGLMAGQAASIQDQLAYSRNWEREADRLGMKTLVDAGYDPNAMAGMFTQMMAANRIGANPPEFLLTHPLTMNRVSDAAARAESYPAKPREKSFTFELLKNLAKIRYKLTPEQVETALMDDTHSDSAAVRNAAWLTLARYHASQTPEQSAAYLEKIDAEFQTDPSTVELKARLLAASGNPEQALQLLQESLRYYPDSYLLTMTKAEMLGQNQQHVAATELLRKLSEQRPTTPLVWQALSKAAAESNQLTLAYHANAEYLFLNGDRNMASRQMDLAIKEAGKQGNFQRQQALKERLRQMASSQERLG